MKSICYHITAFGSDILAEGDLPGSDTVQPCSEDLLDNRTVPVVSSYRLADELAPVAEPASAPSGHYSLADSLVGIGCSLEEALELGTAVGFATGSSIIRSSSHCFLSC
jgi:hypothetical protein